MYTTLVAPEGINITEQVISKGVLNEQTLRGILHHLPQIVTAQWGTLWIFSALQTGCVDFFNGRYITSARTNSGKFGIDAVHSLLSLRSGLFEYVQSTVSKRIPCTSFSLDTRRVLELANMLALNSCVEHNSRVPDSCNLIIADPLDPSCDYPHANLESVVELYKLDELALARVLCCTPTAHTPPSDQSVVDLLQQESAVPVLNSWYPPIASESFQAYTSSYKFEQSGAEFEALGDFVDSGDLLLTEEEIEAAVCDLANYELYAAADYDSDYQFELDQLNLKLSAQQASSCKKFLTVKEERACRVRRPRRVGKMLLPVSQVLVVALTWATCFLALCSFLRQQESLTRSAELHLQRGTQLIAKGAFAEALKEITQSSKLRTEASTYCYCAIALAGLGRYDEALKNFDLSLRTRPTPLVYLSRAKCLRQLHRSTEAIGDLNRLVELSPDPSSYYERGLARLETNQPADAANDFSRALLNYSGGDIFKVYASRAKAQSLLDRYEGAIADYQKVLSLNPPEASADEYSAAVRRCREEMYTANLDN